MDFSPDYPRRIILTTVCRQQDVRWLFWHSNMLQKFPYLFKRAKFPRTEGTPVGGLIYVLFC